MSTSLAGRFVDVFLGGFFRTLKERVIDGLLLLLTLLFWFSSGKFRAHLWECIAPWIWGVCIIVFWHTVRTAKLLWKETTDELANTRARKSSIILSEYGEPFEVAKTDVALYRAKIFGIALFVVVCCGFASYGVLAISRTPEQPPQVQGAAPSPAPTAIFMQCDIAGLPFTIPAHSSLHYIEANANHIKAINWGLDEVRNDSDAARQWPSKEILARLSKAHGDSLFQYRCAIRNLGQVNVFDLAIPFKFWFGDKGGEENAVQYTAIVSPLDGGKETSLYVINNCPVTAFGVLPDDVTLQVVGEASRRKVKLNLPHRNPVDPIMMWFPSSIRWVNGSSCA